MQALVTVAELVFFSLMGTVLRWCQLRLKGAGALVGYKESNTVFTPAAASLGLHQADDTLDQLTSRIPAVDRLKAVPLLRGSFIRLRYTGVVDDVPVELLDWSDGRKGQQTIVVMPHKTPSGAALTQPLTLRSVGPLSRKGLFENESPRPLKEFEGRLQPLQERFFASSDQVVDLLAEADGRALLIEAQTTAPFEIQFRSGEVVFMQSLNDVAERHEDLELAQINTVGAAVKSLWPKRKTADDRAHHIEEIVHRAIRIRAAITANVR